MLTHLQNKTVSKSNLVLAHFVITFIRISLLFLPPNSTTTWIRGVQWHILNSRWQKTPTFRIPAWFRHVIETQDYLQRLQCKQVMLGLEVPRAAASDGRGTSKHVLRNARLCRNSSDFPSGVFQLNYVPVRAWYFQLHHYLGCDTNHCCVNRVSTTTLTRQGIHFQEPHRPTVPSQTISPSPRLPGVPCTHEPGWGANPLN